MRSESLTIEDGLADAYAVFKRAINETFFGEFQQDYPMAYGFHPGLSTEKIAKAPEFEGQNVAGLTVDGTAFFNFTTRRLSATLRGVPAGANFDLWFVKNVNGSGRTFKPETGDQFLKVGSFVSNPESIFCGGVPGCLTIDDVSLGNNINFDLDVVVVTRRNQHPSASRVAVAARGILEKRFFRERLGRALDPVTGTIANNFETTDRLVGRGAQLFFNETFGGNGRTCGTCHRAEENLTINPAFIATLPQSDPLFVAENNPALAQLEDRTLLRTRALIRENVDGFDDPTHKFVARSVNHTLALGLTSNLRAATSHPPDQTLGWGGDGAPGRGTLHEFSFGAVVQHFTKNLARRPGIDFRIPTQEELDAMEAFQLFTGRQKLINIANIQFREAKARRGRDLFMQGNACAGCHTDFQPDLFQLNQQSFPTNVANLTPDLPPDDGFLNGNNGFNNFNAPPVVEAADTGPLFHNNAVADIEGAIAFYMSDTFRSSPVARFFFMNFDKRASIPPPSTS